MENGSRGPGAGAADQPSPAECREVLERLLSSRLLKRSERQREFLSYVCERALAEPGRQIREVDIGSRVFGRPPEYDTSQDNIVRVNASDLRHRLEEYFSTIGASEPVVIEMPRGGYRPQFVRRAVPAPAAASRVSRASAPSAAPGPAERSRGFPPWLVPVVCFFMGGLAVWIISHRAPPPVPEKPDQAIVARFWDRMFSPDRETDVIVADSCLSLYQDFTGERVSLDDYLRRVYLRVTPQNSPVPKAYLDMLMSRRYTSLADADFLSRLERTMDGSRRRNLKVYFARDFPAENLRNSNVVIVGSARANPWAEPFRQDLYFRFERDDRTGISVIRNPKPLPGEQAAYTQAGGTADVAESHGVIAFLPNGQNGNALLLAGSGMDSTKAAGEFLTSDRWIQELEQRLGVTGRVRIPHFEVLIYAKRLGASTIGSIEIRAVRKH